MKRITIAAMCLCLALTAGPIATHAAHSANAAPPAGLSNPDATAEARALFERLTRLQSKGVMYAHPATLFLGDITE